MLSCLSPYQFSKNWFSLLLHFLFLSINAVSLEPCVQQPSLPSLEFVKWPTTQLRKLAILYYRFMPFLNWLILPNMLVPLRLLSALSTQLNQLPFTIFLHCQNSCCPGQFLLKYLSRQGTRSGPLVVNPDNSPVSWQFFCRPSFSFINDKWAHHKGQSFCIDAASFAAEQGMSDAQMALGRWKSNAFLKYLRIPLLST